MTTFADQRTADLAVFFNTDEFAETVTYAGTEIAALVEYVDGGHGANANAAFLTVKRSDVAAPAYRDAVVIGSDTWRVHRDDRTGNLITGDDLVWRIPIIRDRRPRIA